MRPAFPVAATGAQGAHRSATLITTVNVTAGKLGEFKFTLSNKSVKTLNPGDSTTLRTTVLLKGTYEYLCTVPGHAAAGMKGLLKVT